MSILIIMSEEESIHDNADLSNGEEEEQNQKQYP